MYIQLCKMILSWYNNLVKSGLTDRLYPHNWYLDSQLHFQIQIWQQYHTVDKNHINHYVEE